MNESWRRRSGMISDTATCPCNKEITEPVKNRENIFWKRSNVIQNAGNLWLVVNAWDTLRPT